MPAAATAEEDHPNSENETRYTKDESVLIPQGLACSWSCMPEGCAMRMTKSLPKRPALGQPDGHFEILREVFF